MATVASACDSFYAYLSNKNLDDSTLPIASTRLPTPINAFENKYEFALRHFEITERWRNIPKAASLSIFKLERGTFNKQFVATVLLPLSFCASQEEFHDMMVESLKKYEPFIQFEIDTDTTPPKTRFALVYMTRVEFSPELQELLHLRRGYYANISGGARKNGMQVNKVNYTFDPLPSRFLHVVSRLAPSSYAFNSVANILGTVSVLRTRYAVNEDRVITGYVEENRYVPCQQAMLDVIEVQVLDHKGQPLDLLQGCIISCVLHFRRVNSVDCVSFALRNA